MLVSSWDAHGSSIVTVPDLRAAVLLYLEFYWGGLPQRCGFHFLVSRRQPKSKLLKNTKDPGLLHFTHPPILSPLQTISAAFYQIPAFPSELQDPKVIRKMQLFCGTSRLVIAISLRSMYSTNSGTSLVILYFFHPLQGMPFALLLFWFSFAFVRCSCYTC